MSIKVVNTKNETGNKNNIAQKQNILSANCFFSVIIFKFY